MLLMVIVAVGVVLFVTIFVISSGQLFYNNASYSIEEEKAVALAEAGIDKAVASLNETGGSYNGEIETQLEGGSFSVTITDQNASTKVIEATGYIPDKQNPKVKRTVTIKTSKGTGVSFGYGVQVGEGGFIMDGGTQITGSVYSNGSIQLSGGARITGDAYVAGGTEPVADQQSACIAPNCIDYTFGKTTNSQLDIAQSFKPNITQTINKVSVKLKKVGSPPNITVRILADNSGSPSKNTVLATGTLNAGSVTTSYGYIDVAFTTNPSLTANTTYWLILDTTANTTNYWNWSMDTLQGYTRGNAKWSPNWSAGNPSWTNISGDLDFMVYMGGITTQIQGNGSGFITGSAYANTLKADNSSALQIGQHAYYKNVEANVRAHTQSCVGVTNSYCHPNSPDPAPYAYPISQANIQSWIDDAALGGTQTGNLTIQWPCTTVLQKKHYVGNVVIQGGCTIDAETPVWITGNLTVTSGATLRLKSLYGETSGILVVDGKVDLNGGSRVLGSGAANSYMLVLSTYTSPGGGTDYAIRTSGGNSSSILYAKDGVILLEGGANLREVTAKQLRLTGGSIVTYETGVANPVFSSGPQGEFTVIKGTYQAK